VNDHYFDDYEHDTQRDRGGTRCASVVLLCVVIIGFLLFFMVYTVIWAILFESLLMYSFELATTGVILAVIVVVYLVRNKSIEKRNQKRI
jgi:hypothetical protein